MLTVDEVFSNAEKNYLNSAYSPKTVDDYLPNWEAEGLVYLGNWIDLTKESEDSKKALLKLFIPYKAFKIPQMLAYSEDLRVNLNENLKQVQKRQLRENSGNGSVMSNTNPQRFGNEFFDKYK